MFINVTRYCFALHRLCALLLPELSSFIAAMLFAVHPIHTEAVSIKSHKGSILTDYKRNTTYFMKNIKYS